jgi:GTP-binding protein
VIFKEENGKKLEPMEEVIFEITNDYSGGVVENIGKRKGELLDMKSVGTNSSRITALIPSRTLMGYRTDFETDTRGSGDPSILHIYIHIYICIYIHINAE